MAVLDENGGRYSVLLVEWRHDWAAIRRLIGEAMEILALHDAEQRPDVAKALVNALALSLHHIYSAVEASFERVAKYVDQRIPQGSDWHAELLWQMSLDIPGVRPAIIPAPLKARLDEYRRFRHVVRKGYEHALEWERMERHVRELPALERELAAAFGAFEQFLVGIIDGLDD